MSLAASEFILNADGSIYHLQLKLENLAKTVILVGDPDRVERVSAFFDNIEFSVKKREFYTQTGTLNNKRISVISTGIGTDNIDIVLNELDALANIDFETKSIKEEKTSLDIVRIGTSGAIQPDIPVDSFVISEMGLGLDGLLHFYDSKNILEPNYAEAFQEQVNWSKEKPYPYFVSYDRSLGEKLTSKETFKGITATNVGFYGPQGRVLRLALQDAEMNDKMHKFSFQNRKITNMEMETSAIYGLSKLLGHRAVSMNAIVANRAKGTFSKDSKATIKGLIQYTLQRLTQ